MDEQEPKENNNLTKEALKAGTKSIKQKVVSMIMPHIIPIILIMFAGALLLGIFNAVGDSIQELLKGGTVSFFTLDHDGAIAVTNEQIDAIIDTILDMGISIDGLKLMGDVDYNNPDIQVANREAMRKYIKEFYEAQAITETLNTKPGWFENWTKGDKVYGSVYVYRLNEGATDSNDAFQLGYLSPADFQAKVDNKASDIKKYFTINDKNELVFANINQGNGNNNIETEEVDYRAVISQYTTNMNFLLYLCMVSENPEFVVAVADLIKDSKIDITIMDEVVETETIKTETYIEHTIKGRKDDAGNYTEDSPTETTKGPNQTNEKYVTTTPKLAITYAKTWFAEQTIVYQQESQVVADTEEQQDKTTNPDTLGDETPKQINQADLQNGEEATATWITDRKVEIQEKKRKTTYKEGQKGNVIDKTGNKGDGKKSFIGLLDEKFKIPNTTRYERAGENIVSGAEMFFYLIEKDSSLQNLESVMRYILYKYTGKEYGETSFDFNIFSAKEFQTVGGGGIQQLADYIHYFESRGHPATNADGTKYIIVDDGYGNLGVGNGIDIYNGGFDQLFRDKGYKIELGEEVDKEFVDKLEEETIKGHITTIEAATAGLNLKSYQIYALVSRAYNCGDARSCGRQEWHNICRSI